MMSPSCPTVFLFQVSPELILPSRRTALIQAGLEPSTCHSIALRSFQTHFRTSFLGTQQKRCSTRCWSSFSSRFCRFRSTKAVQELGVPKSVNSYFNQPLKTITLDPYATHEEIIPLVLFSSSFFQSVYTFIECGAMPAGVPLLDSLVTQCPRPAAQMRCVRRELCSQREQGVSRGPVCSKAAAPHCQESTPVQEYAKKQNDCEQPALKGPGETGSHSGLDKCLHRPGHPLVSQATKETA